MKNQTIQVLGTGCPKCKKFLEQVKKNVAELKIDAKVEYVTDIAKIVEMGVMTTPALAVNDKVVLIGGEHSDEKIKNALKNILNQKEENNNCCCSCNCCG